MSKTSNDFVITIATVNGSGSQSANSILLKCLFRMGIPVGGKNIFPSNISGLPTWFWIRANLNGYLSHKKEADIVVAVNQQTLLEDVRLLSPGGYLIFDPDEYKGPQSRSDIDWIPVPFKKIADQSQFPPKLKKLLLNMIYVGVLAELLKLDETILEKCIQDQFAGKASAIEANLKAMQMGKKYAQEHLSAFEFKFIAKGSEATKNKVVIDGNTAASLGLLYGGCSFVSWYPITPSSSLIENFESYAKRLRKDQDGKSTFAVVQAEDELASICMVLGAGWAGCRAMTATSGPGLSLMAEAAGYAYYAEIPSVIWDVQRVGPSTGMPTRTAQGDLISAIYLSHGDTQHPILIPANPKECFSFAQTCFDLAERLQQLVIVLSDLDLGMNLWMEDQLEFPKIPMDRGKVLSLNEIQKSTSYFRYEDKDGDAIAYRTLPGTRDSRAAYFTRGSSHNMKGNYTESSLEYQELIDRLKKKWETAKNYVPRPLIKGENSKVGIIAYGSTDSPMQEARDLLAKNGIETDYLRIRALPFTQEIEHFLDHHEVIYLVEQNRDGQMMLLLKAEFANSKAKLKSILHYDGSPITADFIFESILSSKRLHAL